MVETFTQFWLVCFTWDRICHCRYLDFLVWRCCICQTQPYTFACFGAEALDFSRNKYCIFHVQSSTFANRWHPTMTTAIMRRRRTTMTRRTRRRWGQQQGGGGGGQGGVGWGGGQGQRGGGGGKWWGKTTTLAILFFQSCSHFIDTCVIDCAPFLNITKAFTTSCQLFPCAAAFVLPSIMLT